MNICEIFSSISGEGGLTIPQGQVCTFIRLQGCNYRCNYCDAAEATPDGMDDCFMPIDKIIEKVEFRKSRYVLITGGEPLLQETELMELVMLLIEKGYHVQIETNGSIPIPNYYGFTSLLSWVVDFKTPAAGECFKTIEQPGVISAKYRRDCIYKIVLDDTPDCWEAFMKFREIIRSRYTRAVLISAKDSDIELMQKLVAVIRQTQGDFYHNCIFSLQLHKMLKLP